MQINRLARIVAAAALGASVCFAAASPAMADSTIAINPGNVPTTAAAFDPHTDCDAKFGGGPYADKDVWVFNLPGKVGETGVFTSITATFDTNGPQPGGEQDIVIPSAGVDGAIVLNGTSKAYVVTAAGWTLVTATATITGTAPKFVLTHTCAAPSPTPSESASTPPGGGTPGCEEGSTAPECTPGGGTPGCEEGSTAPECSPSPSPSCSSAMPGGATPSPCQPAAPGGGGGESGGLPVTGVAAGSIAVGGLALIGAGAALMIRRRRKFVA